MIFNGVIADKRVIADNVIADNILGNFIKHEFCKNLAGFLAVTSLKIIQTS